MKAARINVCIVIKTVTNVRCVFISVMVYNVSQSVLSSVGETVLAILKQVSAMCVLLDILGNHALRDVVNGVTRASFVTKSLDNVKTALLAGMVRIV